MEFVSKTYLLDVLPINTYYTVTWRISIKKTDLVHITDNIVLISQKNKNLNNSYLGVKIILVLSGTKVERHSKFPLGD